MSKKATKISNQLTLAIHSNDDSFGFAYRRNNTKELDKFFIKKFDNDLCNNLIVDFNKFISEINIKTVNKICVSIGPANFNVSRMIVVLARTISQQINCPIYSFSCFELISKRIIRDNNILSNQSFWIYKKLKRKGFIAGKYEICLADQKKGNFTVKEKIVPKLLEGLVNTELNYQAKYSDEDDLRELLNLSNNNSEKSELNSWKKVLPLYPISAIN